RAGLRSELFTDAQSCEQGVKRGTGRDAGPSFFVSISTTGKGTLSNYKIQMESAERLERSLLLKEAHFDKHGRLFAKFIFYRI
ncbi:hypothetical protein, partial [Bittarella massiliensis (ex Durand et al. 2017)]